jgi:tungstate transport system substrate-binding protein
LQLGRDGNADVVLVHARPQEDQFVADGHGTMRREVMYNDFVILGAAADPAGIRGSRDAAEALKKIASAGATFISRGDGSGTHLKEQQLWRATGLPLDTKSVVLKLTGGRKEFESVRPTGRWYLSIGQGMGKTIIMATEKRAYTLADRGTYYAFALARPARTDLEILYQGDRQLFNPYGVIAVNPDRHPHINFAAAKSYIEWITSPRVQQMIDEFTVGGKKLFHPNADQANRRDEGKPKSE